MVFFFSPQKDEFTAKRQNAEFSTVNRQINHPLGSCIDAIKKWLRSSYLNNWVLWMYSLERNKLQTIQYQFWLG